MRRKSRLLGIVSHAMLIQESINSNNYFQNKIHSLPELTIYITFTSVITPYIACESDNTRHKRSRGPVRKYIQRNLELGIAIVSIPFKVYIFANKSI
jgi:hypothetical protein